MRGEQILDALEQVDEELLYETQCVRQRRNKRWRVLVPLAACLCLVMAGTVVAQPWRSLTPSKGLSNQEESNQIEMENGSAGVYVPPLEVDVGADAAVEADMVGFSSTGAAATWSAAGSKMAPTWWGRKWEARTAASTSGHLGAAMWRAAAAHGAIFTPSTAMTQPICCV